MTPHKSVLEYLQKDINFSLDELKALKDELEQYQFDKTKEKINLQTLTVNLDDQKKIVETNKSQKNNLLSATKNKEENYKKILEEKLEKKEAFLSEISDLEMQLQIEIDPNSLPSVGSGVLKWPLDIGGALKIVTVSLYSV